MKVTILESTVAAKKNVKKGDVIDLDIAEAQSLIGMGKAKSTDGESPNQKAQDQKDKDQKLADQRTGDQKKADAKKMDPKKVETKKGDQATVTGPVHGDKDDNGKK